MKQKKEILEKILTSNNILDSIYENIDILLEIIPEINDMIDFKHNHPHHHLDVWNHTLFALDISYNKYDIRLSLLLHDIGKPHSYQDNEIRHFKGHAHKSSEISRNILNRLDYDKEYINKICYLIENHDNFITDQDIENDYGLSLKRFAIQYCDALAHNPEKLEKRIQYLKNIIQKFEKINPTIKSKIKSKMKYSIVE